MYVFFFSKIGNVLIYDQICQTCVRKCCLKLMHVYLNVSTYDSVKTEGLY